MKTTLFIFFLTVSLASFSQHWGDKSANVRMVHSIGVAFEEFKNLDMRIAEFPQYKELRDHMGVLSFGWLKEKKGIISLMGLTLGSSMSGDRDEKSSVIRFYGLSADIGYDVIKNANIMLYPMVGIGYEKYQAKFYKDNSAVDFNTVLSSEAVQSSVRALELKNSFLTYRAGLGFNISSPKKPSHSIGLQAGYVGSFKDKEWRSSEDQKLANAPEDELGRIWVTLSFISQPRFMK